MALNYISKLFSGKNSKKNSTFYTPVTSNGLQLHIVKYMCVYHIYEIFMYILLNHTYVSFVRNKHSNHCLTSDKTLTNF